MRKATLDPATQRLLEAAREHAPEGCDALQPIHVLFAFFDGGPLPPPLARTFGSASVRRAMRASLDVATAEPARWSPYRGAAPSRATSSTFAAPGSKAQALGPSTGQVLARAAHSAGYLMARVSPHDLAAALLEEEGVQKTWRAALEHLELETTSNLEGEGLEATFTRMLGRRWLIEALAWTGRERRGAPSPPDRPERCDLHQGRVFPIRTGAAIAR